MACRIPRRLAAPRHHCRRDACGLRDPGVAGLCGAGRACRRRSASTATCWAASATRCSASSRQLAVGPTSAISLMIAASVGALAGGDAVRYAQIASLAAIAVALLCLIAWLFRLSMLVRLISDSILVGFKAGAGLTIIMTQLPSLFGVAGGGHNFFDRADQARRPARRHHWIVLAIGLVAILLLLLGERFCPEAGRACRRGAVDPRGDAARASGAGRCRSPATSRRGCRVSRCRHSGCWNSTNYFRSRRASCCLPISKASRRPGALPPSTAMPSMCGRSFWGSVPPISPWRFGHGYPVAGGLSQSAVNDQAGAKTPLALVICSITLAVCLLFLTGLLTNLPKAVLAASSSPRSTSWSTSAALMRMWRISRIDFYAAAIALVAVLLLGILQGILLAAIASIFLLLARASQPNVAFLGRLPGTGRYADNARNPDVEPFAGVIAFRPRPRCSTSMRKRSSRRCWQGSTRRRTQDWSSAVFRPRPSSIWRAPNAARPPRRTRLPRNRPPDRRRPRAGPRCLAGGGLAEKTDSANWTRRMDSLLGDFRIA